MHRNAPLTPEGRRRLVELIESGWTVAAAAESMQLSRQCAHKWWRRYQLEGDAGLVDRSSRPRSCPHQTPARVERRVLALRQARRIGPARLAGIVGLPPATVYRILVRHGMNRLRWMDRATGRVIRRINTSQPGELVHIDVKKLAVIPPGGGHRKLGREARTGSVIKRGHGYNYIHTAIDAVVSIFSGAGGHELIGPVYGQMGKYAEDHGYAIHGPGRDHIVSLDDAPDEIVFELQLPVSR